mgnify:CR=1 FL=1
MAIATSTALIVAAAATAVGAGVSAYSSYQSGQATKRLMDYNAKLANQDAMVRERDGRILANAQRDQNRRLLAKQRALYGAAGVDMTGTPLLVEAEQAGQLEMAALEVERTASIEAGRYRQQAVIDRMQGKQAAIAGGLNAAGTILQGAGQAAGYAGQASYYKSQGY